MKNNIMKLIKITIVAFVLVFSSKINIFASTDFIIKTNDEGKKVLTEYKGDSKKVIVPYGVQIIEGFEKNKKVKEVVLPNTVEEIGEWAFCGCKNLKTIKFPKNLKRIWTGGFANCKKLKTIKINKKLKVIDEFAFDGCSGLEKISVEKGNKKFKIYKGALCNKKMTQLIIYPASLKGRTKFTIPKSIKYVLDGSFYKNKYLKKITVNGKTKFPGDFKLCKALEIVIFKGAYDATPEFANCKKLKKVVLAEGTKRIGTMQFKGCKNLVEINFPSSLETIEEEAFAKCKKINKKQIPKTIEIDNTAFEQ